MTECYRFTEYTFEKGLLDNIIDCTYIIIMENSKNEEKAIDFIQKFKPSKKVIFQYNKGYKQSFGTNP